MARVALACRTLASGFQHSWLTSDNLRHLAATKTPRSAQRYPKYLKEKGYFKNSPMISASAWNANKPLPTVWRCGYSHRFGAHTAFFDCPDGAIRAGRCHKHKREQPQSHFSERAKKKSR